MKIKKTNRIIVWLRRELRVEDNLALWSACQDANEVIPLYIVEQEQSSSDRFPPKVHNIIDALVCLRKNLQSLGGTLFIRSGSASEILVQLIQETNAGAVYVVRDDEPNVQRMDNSIRSEIEKSGKRWVEFQDHTLFDTSKILNQSGNPYTVFTPYKRAFRMFEQEIPPPLPPLQRVQTPDIYPGDIDASFKRDTNVPLSGQYSGGEDEANTQLKNFSRNKLSLYHEQRDLPGLEGTSRLSRHLAIGSLGVRTLFHHLTKTGSTIGGMQKQGVQTFYSQLIWREFYYQVLANFPHTAAGSFKKEFDNVQWTGSPGLFDAWCEGKTGYPVVDAAMRQLNTEGWMHNRGRMIVASFLTKDLHIDWKRGEEYFMSRLIDGDVALNNGGWQWSAGTGTDAQPWFRVFNPILQGKKFDPDGAYVHRYVPELSNVPLQYIHQPWLMPDSLQRSSGCVLGKDYPKPIVDHDAERRTALALYSTIRRTKQAVHEN